MATYFTTFILPPGLFILLGLLGLALYRLTLGKILLFITIISLWLASMPYIAYNLIDHLQYQFHILDFTEAPPKNAAIVILGGGDTILVEQNNHHTISSTTYDRVRYAAFLHKKLNLPIIVSGGTDGAAETEADLMSNTLMNDFGIASTIKENKSKNTIEESEFLLPILEKNGFNTIYLVTNAWHMPRSIYIFKQQGINVIPAPMGYEVYDHRYTLLSFLPDMNALNTTSIAAHEFIGMLWYSL